MKAEKITTLAWQIITWKQSLQTMCPVTVTGGQGLRKGYALVNMPREGEMTILFYGKQWEHNEPFPLDTDLMVFGHHDTIEEFQKAVRDRRQQDHDDTAPKYYQLNERALALIAEAKDKVEADRRKLVNKMLKAVNILMGGSEHLEGKE